VCVGRAVRGPSTIACVQPLRAHANDVGNMVPRSGGNGSARTAGPTTTASVRGNQSSFASRRHRGVLSKLWPCGAGPVSTEFSRRRDLASRSESAAGQAWARHWTLMGKSSAGHWNVSWVPRLSGLVGLRRAKIKGPGLIWTEKRDLPKGCMKTGLMIFPPLMGGQAPRGHCGPSAGFAILLPWVKRTEHARPARTSGKPSLNTKRHPFASPP